MCGEKERVNRCACWTEGSPPRVRGKDDYFPDRRNHHGITPACAGKSFPKSLLMKLTWDHPRVCGEKCKKGGSRGNPARITPACAGKSPGSRRTGRRRLGSPPRVRGKAMFFTAPAMLLRITPACAGKRRCTTASVVWFWDHPRVCGEKAPSAALFARLAGSPPRVRGKAPGFLFSPYFPGITPACAGKRLREGLKDKRKRDHPRVCGEKL